MFQLTEMTEAMLASVTNRTEAHGDDRRPAVSLGLELSMANTILDSIDPTLRQALYKAKPDDQPELPELERTTPILRCNSIDRVTLPTTYTGWTLAVDDGIDDTQPMVFGGCKVDKFSVEAKQGGTVVLRLRVGTSDIDAERLGKLGMHNGQAIWVTVTKPEKAPDAIDGSVEAFKKDHPDATDLFAGTEGDADPGEGDPDEHDGDDGSGHPDVEDDEDAGPELEDRLDNALALADAVDKPAVSPVDGSADLQTGGTDDGTPSSEQPAEPQRSENWPFPKGGSEKSDEQRSAERLTAQREQAEIEAGMQQSVQAAGLKPKAATSRRPRKAVGAVE